MTVLKAKTLTLLEVHRLLNFQRQPTGAFTPHLDLEALSEYEQLELRQIREDFEDYFFEGKILEGQVKLLAIGPLLKLAGFYHSPIRPVRELEWKPPSGGLPLQFPDESIRITLEQDIANVLMEDGNRQIAGRYDILSCPSTKPYPPPTMSPSGCW